MPPRRGNGRSKPSTDLPASPALRCIVHARESPAEAARRVRPRQDPSTSALEDTATAKPVPAAQEERGVPVALDERKAAAKTGARVAPASTDKKRNEKKTRKKRGDSYLDESDSANKEVFIDQLEAEEEESDVDPWDYEEEEDEPNEEIVRLFEEGGGVDGGDHGVDEDEDEPEDEDAGFF